MTRVVGLCGYATAGKDEAARGLKSVGFERVSFADPVRAGVLALNPILLTGDRIAEWVEFVGWEEAKKDKEVRRLLQAYGTEAGRQIHGDDCWVKIAERKAEEIMGRGGNVVFTDARFKNEVEMIRRMGGLVIRITRPGCGPVNSHVSDSMNIEYDLTINNDCGVAELHNAIRRAVGTKR